MRFLYTLFIHVYRVLISFASVYNSKAKRWIDGRKNILEKINKTVKEHENTIWFHSASLGEFEQGRPLIEKLKNENENLKIVLTFFSPSGYEIRKNYPIADYVFYLPLDTPENAQKFISIIKPKAAFFIKYEFWFNYLHELKKNNIPTFLISGILRNEHYFFKWYGGYFRKQLSSFTHFYMQDENSATLLNKANYNNVTISGDTRFDRVFELKKKSEEVQHIVMFKQNSLLLIAGSTWHEDENIISRMVLTNLHAKIKIIIAPHEVNEHHISEIEKMFKNNKTLLFSRCNNNNISTADVLIIDSIGILSSLYKYGTWAYIGGGFGKGIHNILEAATFGLPVFFGPNYNKFNEAIELIAKGGAFCIKNENDLSALLANPDEEKYKTAATCSLNYINNKKGATEIIVNSIKNYISL